MRQESSNSDEEFVGLKFLYRPGASNDAPLIVLVHGRGGNVQVMWSFERSLPADAAVVSFEATLPDKEVGGKSWWELGATEPAGSEEVLSAVRRVSYALSAFIQLQGLNPTTTVFLGFSQGAALIAAGLVSGALHGDGFGLLCGFIPRFVASAPAIDGTPQVFVGHGTLDRTVSVERAQWGVQFLRDQGLMVTFIEEEVEHKLGIQCTRGLRTWLEDVVH